MPDYNVTAAILCDEVRMEHNNKIFLIGIYSGAVTVQSLPIALALSVYVEIESLGSGDHAMEIRVTTPGGESGLSSVISQPETGPAVIPTPRMPFNVSQPGDIEVELKLDDGDWRRILRKQVLLVPAAVEPEELPRATTKRKARF